MGPRVAEQLDPVIRGIRWSAAISATGSSRRASLVSTDSASAPEVTPMTR